MNDKIYNLLEIYFAHQNNDMSKRIDHFVSISNSLFILTQCLFDNNEKVKYFQLELEGRLFRFGLANQSLINLIKGNHFTLINEKVQIGDIFSIISITRMQIESFLIMFYSNYAHSEHISDRQYNSYCKMKKSITDSYSLIITINTILTSKLILYFKDSFRSVEKNYLELNSLDRDQIEFWNKVKTK